MNKQATSAYRKANFYLSDPSVVGIRPGYTSDSYFWNGFDCPLFTLDQVFGILNAFHPSVEPQVESQLTYTYDPASGIFTVNFPADYGYGASGNDPAFLKPVAFECDSTTLRGYDIFTRGWCWSEWTDDDSALDLPNLS